MPSAQYQPAIAHAIGLLEHNLSPRLAYHNLWHTRDEVMPAAVRLARMSDFPDDEIALIEVAGAYHDIGFTEGYAGHELIGVRIVAQTLPEYGFDARQIERVIGMVLATRLPQAPRNPLEEILADADLDVLGREDFFERNALLHQELGAFGSEISPHDWRKQQLQFMKQHTYFSAMARILRDTGKYRHMAALSAQIGEQMEAMGAR